MNVICFLLNFLLYHYNIQNYGQGLYHTQLDSAGLEHRESDSQDPIWDDDQPWKLPFMTLPLKMPYAEVEGLCSQDALTDWADIWRTSKTSTPATLGNPANRNRFSSVAFS